MNVDDALAEELVLGVETLAAFTNLVSSFQTHVFGERVVGNVEEFGELEGDLKETIISPVTEPIDDTSVEQGGGTGCPVREVRICRVHREHHMKVALHILRELLVQLFLRVDHPVRLARLFLAHLDQLGVVVAIE